MNIVACLTKVNYIDKVLLCYE